MIGKSSKRSPRFILLVQWQTRSQTLPLTREEATRHDTYLSLCCTSSQKNAGWLLTQQDQLPGPRNTTPYRYTYLPAPLSLMPLRTEDLDTGPVYPERSHLTAGFYKTIVCEALHLPGRPLTRFVYMKTIWDW